MPDEEILAIEKSAFAAWPAAEVERLGGWRLRFNHGVTNRGSSVWPGPDAEAFALSERLDAVERFYTEREARACYQLSPVCDPTHLDGVLEALAGPLADNPRLDGTALIVGHLMNHTGLRAADLLGSPAKDLVQRLLGRTSSAASGKADGLQAQGTRDE